ncbi:Protein of unknown function (DUF3325) [Methylophaga frappieri]|uniref:DUF3325 domain-containing protein n=1 Tax=Methylophaga frappieri (strain ATCC BAA-2434 / DSM 25690 / JAM7) TaxID=754477 RepID=I1YL83_METFJ|nr:DUF3325 domain-containing protein [Methylophaga frappieri]AFJ03676.1 Protein of unknown function (DUF3325) [Methylophaga frappieri]
MSLDALLLAGAVICSISGFAWLALAMNEHWKQVQGDQPWSKTGQVLLRVAGSSALFVSLVLCNLVDHATMAVLVWVMAMTAGALMVAFTLTWRPAWLCLFSWLGRLGRA